MTLEKVREAYYASSSSASSVGRQVAFAGIAIIWIFKQQSEYGIALPKELAIPIGLLIGALSSDLLQYIVCSAIWGIFHRVAERKYGTDENTQVEFNPLLNWPALFFFWIKLALIAIAYCYLLNYATTAVWFS